MRYKQIRRSKAPLNVQMSKMFLIIYLYIAADVGFTHRSFLLGVMVFGFLVLCSYFVLRVLAENKHQKALQLKMFDIDAMKGEEFEEYLMHLFQKKGYKVKTTAKTGDFGADLILEKDRKRIVVQAKRYKAKVGNGAVQEVTAAIRHYNASSGMVITNSYFTKPAQSLASSNDIELWDRNVLEKEVLAVSDNK